MGGALCALLLLTGVASGATSFSDPTGDDQASPDITSVAVTEPVAGTLSVVVTVSNYQTLPQGSWFDLWFDLDRNGSTGDGGGDDALVRLLAEGGIQHFLWNGTRMAATPATGMTGSYNAGVATVTIPKSGAFAVSTFGILAVGARSQTLGGEVFLTTDFAPNSGRSAWTSPTPGSFPDTQNDHETVPDIGQVRVTDAKSGWIRFEIATPNRRSLSDQSAILVTIDADSNRRTGDGGADLALTDFSGELQLERWSASRRAWRPDTAPVRIRERSQANLVVAEIHSSELESPERFAFQLTSIGLDRANQIMGFDFAPNFTWWRYKLTNPIVVRLLAARAVGVPARPRLGAPFTISVPVRRSDTNQAVTTGSVSCNVVVAGKRVRAQGRLRAGKAQCTLRVPSAGATVRGSLTVLSGGAKVTSRFSFRVR